VAETEVVTASAAETEALAGGMATRLRSGDIVLVSGELGAGKTTFVRGACRTLGVTDRVTSPTFTIGHRYRGEATVVSHLDLYRFQGLSPAEWGDLEPYFDDAVVFVEWPEAGESFLPPSRARVRLTLLSATSRLLVLETDDDALLEDFPRADPGVRHGD